MTVTNFPRTAQKWWITYGPIIFFGSYTVLSFLLFGVGPLSTQINNWLALISFLTAVVIAFCGGFVFVWRWLARADWQGTEDPPNTYRRDRWLIIGGIVWYLVYSILSILSFGVTSPAALIEAILDPRGSYYDKFEAIVDGPIWILPFQVLNLTGALHFLLVPLAVYHWHRLTWRMKTAAIIAVTAYLAFFLAVGTQKGIADTLIALVVVMVAVGAARFDLRVLLKRFRWVVLGVVAAGLGLVLVILFSLGTRTDNTSTAFQNDAMARLLEQLSPVLGPNLARGLLVASLYFSQGYLGLSYSMRLPFEWTGGLGALPAFSSYLPQYFGIPDPRYNTYPYRVAESFDWSATGKWSTVYPWLASDLSFPGVVVLMLLLGAALALIWRHYLVGRSSIALALLVVVAFFAFYSPANNQLFIQRYSAIGVTTIVLGYAIGLVWHWRRRRAPKNGVAHEPHAGETME